MRALRPVRWLLVKDLQILRRSPLTAALLIAYPILIALLVGFAISRGPAEPRVALLNQLPPDASIGFGGEELEGQDVRNRLCGEVECVDVETRAEADEMVESGDATAAVVIPEDLAEDVASLASLNPRTPTVKVVVNESDPVKAQVVDDRISSLLAEANLLIATRISEAGGKYLDLILDGGTLDLLGTQFDILGLHTAERQLEQLKRELPPGSAEQRQRVDELIRFTRIAGQNLDLAAPLLNAVAEPIDVEKQTVGGKSPPLDVFGVGVAATFTLMFVTVLLVAGSLALEREENAFARLTAGLISKAQLLGAKLALGTAIGLAVTLIMLLGLWAFVPLEGGRFALWVLAALLGAAAFAAAGATLGAATREVRAASLLAFMVCLPVALLSLVPDGTVGSLLSGVIDAVAAIFPFKPSLDAISAALTSSGADLLGPLVHLAILVMAYGGLARLALRRF